MVRSKKNRTTQQEHAPKEISLFFNKVRLLSVSCERKLEFADDKKLIRNNRIESVSLKDGKLRISVVDEVGFEPEGPFYIEAKAFADYHTEGELPPVNELKENDKMMEDLSNPAFSLTSLVIGFLTDKLIGRPLIVPPFLEMREKEENRN